jgi:hypothetical protein
VPVAVWPGALEAGVGDPVPYIAVAVGFVIAYPFAFLANRYMIARGWPRSLQPRAVAITNPVISPVAQC